MQAVIEKFRDIFAGNAENPAIIDCLKKSQYTYGELEDLSSRTAYYLSQYTQCHDRVVLLLSNSTEMVISYLACMQAGLTSIPVNADFHEEEIRTIIKACAPAMIVADAQNARKLPSNLQRPIVQWGQAEPDITLASMHNLARLDNRMFPHIEDGSLAHIFFSSGTTGMPKAIPITFGRIIGHAFMFAKSHRLDASCRFYSVLPLAYLGGWYNLTLVPLLSCATIVLDRVFGAAGIYRYWSTVLEQGVNSVWFTPSMLSALLSIGTEDNTQAEAIKRQIRWSMVGMAPLMPDLKKRFEETFGFRLQQSYGLSETFLFTSWMSDTSLPDSSVGKCLEEYEIRIVGASGEALPAEGEGEIRVKGKWIFDGYWNQDELTASAFDEAGYFRTGDAGHFDADGNIFITGRLKDLIIRSGINIAPAEIENVLYGIQGVREAAIVGIPDDLYGEKVIAFVTRTTQTLTAENIVSACRQSLNALKIPVAVHILQTMPLNASGKIDKKALKEMLLHV